MPPRPFRCLAVCVVFAAGPALAQQRPSPQDAEALLRSSPDLAAQVRQRLRDSGLTPEQVRARLRAEGYPESLLDSYLSAGSAGGDSVPSATTLAALRALAIEPEVDSLGRPLMSGTGRNTVAMQPTRPYVTCDTVAATSTPGKLADSTLLDARRDTTSQPRVTCKSSDGRVVPPPDSGRTIFGLDLFTNPTSQFDPNVAGPVDRSYRLSPGDQMVLLLTGEVELAHRLDVTREGFVFIPQVGQLHVANLSLEQVENVLYST